jgi:putative transposase
MSVPHTIRFTRRALPHWEVEGGRYFVTVRCADSLPATAIARLGEIQRSLAAIESSSPQFIEFQRRHFTALEKYLDAGHGTCPLHTPAAADSVSSEFSALADWHITVPHFTLMPNHWHALLVPEKNCGHSLSAVMKRIKGRTAPVIRKAIGGVGPVWQREWFDRWVRDDAEWEKFVSYIRNNPVKAGLAQTWSDHPWTR